MNILRISSAQIKMHQINFSSNFASIFSAIMRTTYILYTFLAEILYTFIKESLSKYKFDEILLEPVECLKHFPLMDSFFPNHVKFLLNNCRRVISHDTEECCKS